MQLRRILCAALLGGTTWLGVSAGETQTKPVKMDDCLQLALQHNLGIQVARLGPERFGYALRASYSAYEPSFRASATHGYNSTPGAVDAQGRSYGSTDRESDNIQLGLGGLLPYGLNYQIGTSLTDTYGTRALPSSDWSRPSWVTNSVDVLSPWVGSLVTRSLIPGSTIVQDPFEDSSAWVGIQLSQPLLKNFWIDGARYNITLRKKDLKGAEYDLRVIVQQMIVQTQLAYLELIAAQETVKVAEKALQLAEQQLRENRKRVEVGVMAPLDEKQAESAVAGRKADLIAAQNNLTIRQNELKNFLTDKYSEWQNTTLEPIEKLTAVVQAFSRQDSWQKGMTLRPDLLRQRIQLEKSQVTVKYKKNQLFPELDLTGSYGQSGAGKEFSDALRGVSGGDSPAYSFGLSLTVPLSNRQARYDYRDAKAAVQQALLQVKQLEQTIMKDIDNAIAQAQSSLEQIEARKKEREFAEAALDAEQKKLDNGRSTSFIVLSLQRDLTGSRYNEIRAMTDYNKALCNLAYSEGATLERAGIRLEIK